MGALSQRKRKSVIVEHGTVHKPHHGNKTYRSQHSDGRKILHRIHAVVLQNGECRGIGQSDGRHIESHTTGVEQDKQSSILELVTKTCLHTQPPAAQHKATRQEMAQAQHPLRLHILIGHDTHQCRHKDTHDTLDGIEPRDLVAKSCHSEIITHTGEISSPDCKLQEVHQ